MGASKEESIGGDGGKIEWQLFEVNTTAVSRGDNELIGEFKWAAGDMRYTHMYLGTRGYLLVWILKMRQ